MAWTYAMTATASAAASRHDASNNGVWIDYLTYRVKSEIAQMRLTDVPPENGVQFTSCSFQVQLVDSGVAALGSATPSKTWACRRLSAC